jgi:hypothetical protein
MLRMQCFENSQLRGKRLISQSYRFICACARTPLYEGLERAQELIDQYPIRFDKRSYGCGKILGDETLSEAGRGWGN